MAAQRFPVNVVRPAQRKEVAPIRWESSTIAVKESGLRYGFKLFCFVDGWTREGGPN
jgi:hypothetical protein